jgi:hypothetical protein
MTTTVVTFPKTSSVRKNMRNWMVDKTMTGFQVFKQKLHIYYSSDHNSAWDGHTIFAASKVPVAIGKRFIANKHGCTATNRITFHWHISLQVSNHSKSFLIIRRQTENIHHFTYAKCQAFYADTILQKKDHISVVFIFYVPESNCFIIWQSGLGNMPNVG